MERNFDNISGNVADKPCMLKMYVRHKSKLLLKRLVKKWKKNSRDFHYERYRMGFLMFEDTMLPYDNENDPELWIRDMFNWYKSDMVKKHFKRHYDDWKKHVINKYDFDSDWSYDFDSDWSYDTDDENDYEL